MDKCNGSHERRQKKLLNRIRRIKGQMKALESVLQKESSDDCSAVLQQIASIQGGCGRADDDRAGGHIREHIGAERYRPTRGRRIPNRSYRVLRSYVK